MFLTLVQQKSENLTDEELVTLTGGASFPDMTQSVYILRSFVIKLKYGVTPFYGVMPLYDSKPIVEVNNTIIRKLQL